MGDPVNHNRVEPRIGKDDVVLVLGRRVSLELSLQVRLDQRTDPRNPRQKLQGNLLRPGCQKTGFLTLVLLPVTERQRDLPRQIEENILDQRAGAVVPRVVSVGLRLEKTRKNQLLHLPDDILDNRLVRLVEGIRAVDIPALPVIGQYIVRDRPDLLLDIRHDLSVLPAVKCSAYPFDYSRSRGKRGLFYCDFVPFPTAVRSRSSAIRDQAVAPVRLQDTPGSRILMKMQPPSRSSEARNGRGCRRSGHKVKERQPYDASADSLRADDRRDRLDEQGRRKAVHLPADADRSDPGSGGGSRHHDLSPLLPRHGRHQRRRRISLLRGADAADQRPDRREIPRRRRRPLPLSCLGAALLLRGEGLRRDGARA